MKRKALGKGLENIIKNRPVEGERGIQNVDLRSISPNPFQPRKEFNTEKIRELAESISQSGLIQPVTLQKKGDRYYLVVGERRWRAYRLLKRDRIPAYVKPYNEDEILLHGLVENVQREDLNAIEVARGIEELIQKTGLSHEAAAQKVGMSRTALTNYLRLLKLPESVKRGVVAGVISPGHARALLSLRERKEMMTCLDMIKNRKLNVRQTEKLVNGFLKPGSSPRSVKDSRDPDVEKMEDRLSRYLSTRVNLQCSREGRGKIVIYFNQLEEFDRLFQTLLKETNNEK